MEWCGTENGKDFHITPPLTLRHVIEVDCEKRLIHLGTSLRRLEGAVKCFPLNVNVGVSRAPSGCVSLSLW